MNPQAGLGEAHRTLHDFHYRKGWDLARGYFLVADGPQSTLTWIGKWRLRRAAVHLNSALRINPAGWQAMWALGKLYQRLGDHPLALDWFRRAHEISPGQAAIAGEAGIAALEMGNHEEAKAFLQAAVHSRPGDAGLVANLALAQLLCGEVDAASQSAAAAAASNPADRITAIIVHVTQKVREGKCAVPRSMAELMQSAK